MAKKNNKKASKSAPSKPVSKENPLHPKTPRNFRVGGDIQPKRNLGRFVRWPVYVRLQRQRKILLQRLKVPPSINQFKATLSKNEAADLFKFLQAYQPEDKAAKKARLAGAASNEAAGGGASSGAAPAVIKYGLNHVTKLIEDKKAKLVVIAHDVNPIELVIFLPALCKKMNVPYCIIKGKGRLGTLVHKKNAAVVALTKVNSSDNGKLSKFAENYMTQFNNNQETVRKWGGGIMGLKTLKRLEIRAKQEAVEEAKKSQF